MSHIIPPIVLAVAISDSHKVSVEVGSEFDNYDEVKAEGYARYGVAEVK